MQRLHDAPRLAVERDRPAGGRVEHRHADRRGLDQRLEVGARLPLGPVGARAWPGTSAIRSGPSRSRKCSKSLGPSAHSAIAWCSSSVKPAVTKSWGAPVSSMVAMAA